MEEGLVNPDTDAISRVQVGSRDDTHRECVFREPVLKVHEGPGTQLPDDVDSCPEIAFIHRERRNMLRPNARRGQVDRDGCPAEPSPRVSTYDVRRRIPDVQGCRPRDH